MVNEIFTTVVSVPVSVTVSESVLVPGIEPYVPTTPDVVIGVLMVISSLLSVIPNIVVINAINSDKELRRLNAYQFMLYLAYFDTIQLFPHTITGKFWRGVKTVLVFCMTLF